MICDFDMGRYLVSSPKRANAKTSLWVDDFYSLYADWLRARLVRRYGAQEADDLAQEAWLRLVPYGETRDIRYPKALLLKIAYNLAADRRARHQRSEAYIADTVQLHGWDVHSASQTDEIFAKQVVMGLPQPLRDVFVLSRIKGLSNRQIAEQLGISPKTVEWRMTKALAHCTAQFRR